MILFVLVFLFGMLCVGSVAFFWGRSDGFREGWDLHAARAKASAELHAAAEYQRGYGEGWDAALDVDAD